MRTASWLPCRVPWCGAERKATRLQLGRMDCLDRPPRFALAPEGRTHVATGGAPKRGATRGYEASIIRTAPKGRRDRSTGGASFTPPGRSK
jgi:hypothetical protein